MIYATPAMAEEFKQLPEALQAKLLAADAWLKAQGWPELFLTCVGRTDDDSERIYTPVADKLVRDLGLKNLKTDLERVLAGELAKMNALQRKAWARGKFSWHRCLCAVDIRNRVYSRVQRKALLDHLRFGTNTTTHEVLEHDIGRGDHLHVSEKNFEQRKRLLGP
jgi:hypothetical protein